MMAPRSRLIWPFSIPAWKRDTSLLSQAEKCAYHELLMYYWEHGGLPDDDAQLRRIAGTSKTTWRAQRRKLKKFFRDGWKHGRMDADLEAAANYSASRRSAALARWQPVNNWDNSKKTEALSGPLQLEKTKQNQRGSDAYAMRTECSYKIDRLPSISGAVKKWPSNKQASSKQHRAEQAWGNDLRRALGPEGYARAIDLLAADPALVERATQSEIRKPGSGVMAAMIGLSVRESKL